MKISVIFLLLLLVCSDQNMTQAGDTNPARQLANYQPGLQNIRALLRELTVSLAEQKVKITFLQTENQGTVLSQVMTFSRNHCGFTKISVSLVVQ